MNYITNSLIPIILVIIVFYGMIKGKKVYEWFLEGAKEGLSVCMRIFPSLLAMLVAVRILRDSNVLGYINNFLEPIVGLIGLPAQLVPLVLIKPLSGSGALGIFTDILNTVGPDTRTGLIASVLMGTTETIFYTITIYFGAVGIKKIRHTLWTAIMADMIALIMAITMVGVFFNK
ncbi:spore maturation protein [Clostridium massiliamazoniense]|uniref:spore maturation protein n=1 Tax=Clostridium massiliamazoniense TaxID=1347366 RepID=UPI0006D7A6B0|nr:nucleoside recognition domain-containing protein [Clostridium massiliamazoniense]